MFNCMLKPVFLLPGMFQHRLGEFLDPRLCPRNDNFGVSGIIALVLRFEKDTAR